jgi:hypothetical protein
MLPEKLVPQQYAAPEVVRAQVWEFAGAIMTNDCPSETSEGRFASIRFPLPIVPVPEFIPQHKAVPAVVMAHVW